MPDPGPRPLELTSEAGITFFATMDGQRYRCRAAGRAFLLHHTPDGWTFQDEVMGQTLQAAVDACGRRISWIIRQPVTGN